MFQVLTKAINHSCSHEWLEPLVCTIETGCFKPRVGLNYAWLLTMHGFKPHVDFNHSWSWTTALTARGPRLHIRLATTRNHPVTTAHTCVNFHVVHAYLQSWFTRICNRGSCKVIAVAHGYEWLISTRG